MNIQQLLRGTYPVLCWHTSLRVHDQELSRSSCDLRVDHIFLTALMGPHPILSSMSILRDVSECNRLRQRQHINHLTIHINFPRGVRKFNKLCKERSKESSNYPRQLPTWCKGMQQASQSDNKSIISPSISISHEAKADARFQPSHQWHPPVRPPASK